MIILLMCKYSDGEITVRPESAGVPPEQNKNGAKLMSVKRFLPRVVEYEDRPEFYIMED